MAFQDLNVELQEIINFNYFSFSKSYVIFIIFTFSLFYIFYYKKYLEQKTPFLSISILRMLLTAFSVVNLAISPFFFFFLHPQLSFWNLFLSYFSIYSAFLLILLIIFVTDAYRLGVGFVINASGFDMNDKNVKRFNKIVKKISGKI